MQLSREQLLDAYTRMRTIRAFEEKLEELVKAGKLGGFLHLYAGEEAVAVGVCSQLGNADIVTSTHRGHGHCIAKGVDVKGMMAELFGRATGVCKGKGGSMHIADVDCGMLGANGIVGAGIPLTTGAALTAKLKKTENVAVCFFGDGATNQGAFHEALLRARPGQNAPGTCWPTPGHARLAIRERSPPSDCLLQWKTPAKSWSVSSCSFQSAWSSPRPGFQYPGTME